MTHHDGASMTAVQVLHIPCAGGRKSASKSAKSVPGCDGSMPRLGVFLPSTRNYETKSRDRLVTYGVRTGAIQRTLLGMHWKHSSRMLQRRQIYLLFNALVRLPRDEHSMGFVVLLDQDAVLGVARMIDKVGRL